VRILALLAAIVVGGGAPAVTTGTADPITTDSATISGTVDPNGSATTYRVEYGTGAAYGLSTAGRSAGAGTQPVAVTVRLSGLTAETGYHYRLVAENSHGVTDGADATFQTAARPRPPGAATGKPRPMGATTTTLRGTVVANGSPTEYHFEYGTTPNYDHRTPGGVIAADQGLVRPSEPISGLEPNTRYHVRLVATNAAGRTAGVDRTFLTLRNPTGVRIVVEPRTVSWGRTFAVEGAVLGDGIDHITVALQGTPFPFTAPFAQVGLIRTANRVGAFRFKHPPVYSTTRVRVATTTRVQAVSAVATVRVALKVTLHVRPRRDGRAGLTGIIRPAVPNGRARLERQGRHRRWTRLARTRLTSSRRLDRSSYRFALRPPRHARTYRVVVFPRDRGAHVAGVSRSRRLAARG
jgi:hypothetical protein